MAEGTIKKKTDKGFGFIDTGGGEGRELRRAPRRTTSVIHRRKWTKRAKSRKRQSGLRLKRFKAKGADDFRRLLALLPQLICSTTWCGLSK